MRAPRHRFSDDVRSTTRGVASRMVREGTIAQTPEELEAWLAQAPEVRDRMVRGGYGTAFTSHDLFPLLQVFVVQAGGPPPAAAAEPHAPKRNRSVGLLVLLVVAALLLAVVLGLLA